MLYSKNKERTPSVKIKLAWRPATPMFRWSWSQQRPAFILGRNCWLNMTGRKWESGAGDASRYCQITGEDASDQPVSPSCACYLISYIFLINFSGIKVCGGGVSSTLHLQWRGTVWNSNVILNSHRLDANLNLRGGKKKERKRKSWNSSCCSILCYVSHWHIYNYYINSMHSYSLGTDGFI